MPVEKATHRFCNKPEFDGKDGRPRKWRDLIKVLTANPFGISGLFGGIARTIARALVKGNQAARERFADIRRKLAAFDQHIEHRLGRQQPHQRRPFDRFSLAAKPKLAVTGINDRFAGKIDPVTQQPIEPHFVETRLVA